MSRSKVERYIDVINVLARLGPLRFTHVMCKANLNSNSLKELLELLIEQGLVEEHTINKQRVVYAATQKGMIILKYFRELKQALPINE